MINAPCTLLIILIYSQNCIWSFTLKDRNMLRYFVSWSVFQCPQFCISLYLKLCNCFWWLNNMIPQAAWAFSLVCIYTCVCVFLYMLFYSSVNHNPLQCQTHRLMRWKRPRLNTLHELHFLLFKQSSSFSSLPWCCNVAYAVKQKEFLCKVHMDFH